MKPFVSRNYEHVFQRILRVIFSFFHRVLRGLANNLLAPEMIKPREFSNAILRHYAPLFTGDIINVSGWKDNDHEGHFYAEYFPNAANYTLSNAPTNSRGLGSYHSEIALDLTEPLNKSYEGKFDIVFNHTTLEHIFEIDVAFKNLCLLSKDVVILVVPTLQQIHMNKWVGDYHRLTPLAIMRYFEKNGFELLVMRSNEQQFSPVFCFAIAARPNSRYKKIIQEDLDFSMGGLLYGSRLEAGVVVDYRKESMRAHGNRNV